jgi:hypothetical protein
LAIVVSRIRDGLWHGATAVSSRVMAGGLPAASQSPLRTATQRTVASTLSIQLAAASRGSPVVNGDRRSLGLLRPITDTHAQERLRELVLRAYADYEEEHAAEAAS